MNIAALTAAVAAACPISGVAGPIVGPSPWTTYPASNGTQWRIDFDPSTTAAQQQSGIATLAAYVDASPPPTITGNQLALALNSLSLATAWRVGVAKSKDGDQNRVLLIARDTPLVASDPLLARVAANAGNDANGNPLIVVSTVFFTAQGMPL